MALCFLINKAYFFDNAWARWPPTQYVCTIMQKNIKCSIVDIANLLSFAYWGLGPELWLFVLPLTKLTKIRFYLHTQRKAESLAQNDDRPGQIPTILQPATKSLTLQNPIIQSIWSLFLLPVPALRTSVILALATLWTTFWARLWP